MVLRWIGQMHGKRPSEVVDPRSRPLHKVAGLAVAGEVQHLYVVGEHAYRLARPALPAAVRLRRIHGISPLRQ